ncbi:MULTISPECIES: ABC transporter permease [unclassified Microbacterium]|uniref:ABC transporter permease n=1 Tax=unclassified Microbacterium TaxID=2609290 RepID=UPI001E0BE1C5|nr:ABC transporter permease [Microbacterium sp.]CAH0202698.1 Glutathione transport system permease protein GsiC [Microbacterium sp. Bi121]HWK78492.1 ABC transporter permease [Microbacterium sp.]
MTRTSSSDVIQNPDAGVGAPASGGGAAAVPGKPARDAATAARRRSQQARRIVSRLIGAVVVLWGAATAAFLAQVALPGDRATAILNIRTGQAQERTPDELAPIIEAYGLHDPVLVQYLHYITGLLRGDLGTSYQQFRPVWDLIGEQLGATFVLSLVAIALAWVIMVVWVTLTAGRSRRVSAFGSIADTVAAALPPYWLGILLLLVFALNLRWFPVMGGTGIIGIVLPALTLAIPLAGFMGQSVRAEYERALEQPFVLSARMRGMGDLQIRLRHVLRHASLPAVTLTGWAIGATISGAVIVEQIYSRPGIGKTLVSAVGAQDLPVVTGIVIMVALAYVLANLLVDVVYTLIDPRLEKS